MEQAAGGPPAGNTGPSAQPAPASLAEVLRLVQSGRAPPGVRRPHAAPTQDPPTASRLPRPPKPWESRPSPLAADRTRVSPVACHRGGRRRLFKQRRCHTSTAHADISYGAIRAVEQTVLQQERCAVS
uniref:Peroxisomal membrane protein PEX14-like KPWE domain-containing protein n=1 Tax=Dromaius novaehollandiae TaxID=8790 RepID=A0A8C4IWZ2_DRONO